MRRNSVPIIFDKLFIQPNFEVSKSFQAPARAIEDPP
jgi:hypothetical protein